MVTFQVGLWIIRYDQTHKICLLRCDNITKNYVVATLAMIRSIKSNPIIFHTRITTGTIKTALNHWRSIFSINPPKREIQKEKDF
jgi:RNase P/RNase MRP subunit POP5